MRWKKLVIVGCLLFSITLIPAGQAQAGIIEVARQLAIKAIKAADLAIQRQQNKIIWLQNAQKTLENTLSKLKLDEISDWTEKQREQYQQYFDELQKVKMLLSYYQRIKDITQTQAALLAEYRRVWSLVSGDQHFTAKEISYMAKVYMGILSETASNVDELAIIVNSFQTQMSDAKRLEFINRIADKVEENYTDLKTFNAENGQLRLQRVKSASEAAYIKRIYGL
ncbi:MAG: conjugal transfer protein TraI [Bacteroidetes bacterium 43-16]|nr:MAG: conjugal transfer protein TraI [Bacteroidetes bacterium 43-16]